MYSYDLLPESHFLKEKEQEQASQKCRMLMPLALAALRHDGELVRKQLLDNGGRLPHPRLR
jgi:hypothetical protein